MQHTQLSLIRCNRRHSLIGRNLKDLDAIKRRRHFLGSLKVHDIRPVGQQVEHARLVAAHPVHAIEPRQSLELNIALVLNLVNWKAQGFQVLPEQSIRLFVPGLEAQSPKFHIEPLP